MKESEQKYIKYILNIWYQSAELARLLGVFPANKPGLREITEKPSYTSLEEEITLGKVPQ
jgi:hypothetical protein